MTEPDCSDYGYPPPVSDLLTFGDCSRIGAWPDYLALGLGPQHVPDLIRMALDEELHLADPDSLDVWSPVHAWRALGQLRAESAWNRSRGFLLALMSLTTTGWGKTCPEPLAPSDRLRPLS